MTFFLDNVRLLFSSISTYVDMDKGIIGIKMRSWQMKGGFQSVVTALTNTVNC